MTDQNNASQLGLTDDDILQVFSDVVGNQEEGARLLTIDSGQAIRIAHTLLSKLRAEGVPKPVLGHPTDATVDATIQAAYEKVFGTTAGWEDYAGSYFIEGYRAALSSAPVADAQAIHPEIQAVLAMLDVPVLGYLGSHSGKLLKSADMADRFESAIPVVSESAHRAACEKIIGSTASAPVAGNRTAIYIDAKLLKQLQAGEIGQYICLYGSKTVSLDPNLKLVPLCAAPVAGDVTDSDIWRIAQMAECHHGGDFTHSVDPIPFARALLSRYAAPQAIKEK